MVERMDTLPLERPIGDLLPAGNRSGTDQFRDLLQDDELLAEVERASHTIITHLEELRTNATFTRENTGRTPFSTRFKRAANKMRMEFDIPRNPDNSIKRDAENGHMEMGISQGWTAQAVKAATAFEYAQLTEQTERPYELSIKGDATENVNKLKMVHGVLDDMFQNGGFKERLRPLTKGKVGHGTGVLRYEVVRETEFKRQRIDGRFIESIGPITPKYSVWPLDRVLFTNPDHSQAAWQEGVFWETPHVTLERLSRQEATFDVSDGTLFQVGGKFRNLETLRRVTEKGRGVGHTTRTGNDGIVGRLDPNEPETLSSFDTWRLVEYEGAIPWGSIIAAKGMTPRAARVFGIDVGPDPDPDNEAQMVEWARRLEKVKVYQCAYTTHNADASRSERHMLRVEPDLRQDPRNSAYIFRYDEIEDELYGLGISDLGDKMERAGDLMRNIQTWVIWKNAHPSHMVDMTAFTTRSLASIEKLINDPDRLIATRPGTRPNDAVRPFLLEVNTAELESSIAAQKFEFELTTGVSAIQKGGGGSTRTLGELQLKEQKSASVLIHSMLGTTQEIGRLIRDMLQDAFFFRSNGEIIEYVSRVSGLDPSEVLELLPTIEGIENEIIIDSPLGGGEDRAVLTTLIMRILQIIGPGMFTDPALAKFARRVIEISGFPRTRQLGLFPEETKIPSDEHILMMQGQKVNVNPVDDHALHLAQHRTFGELIEAGQLDDQIDEQEIENVKLLLPLHMQEHDTIMEIIAQTQNPATSAGQDQAGNLEQQQGGVRSLEQDTSPASGQGLRNAVTESAANVPGGNL